VREQVPLDIIGLGAEEVGGIGPVSYEDMPAFIAKYRFFFNPIRYTSLGLAVCEAMTIGLPIVGLATTEMVTAIKNDETGYIETDIDKMVERMKYLLDNPAEAARLGENAKQYAADRFNIERFKADWERTLWTFAENESVKTPSVQKPPVLAAHR
jgi:glycosyltransferase involved in cell wall biosynthesis